jgi:shikimate dehydrogenase
VITGKTRVCAIVGDPVRHSLSPILHNAAFAAMDLDIAYVAFPVAIGSGAAAIQAVRTLSITGLSVTMPHKFAAATAVDRLTPQAARLQSCNTVYRDRADPEILWGDSTDGDGFISGLSENGFSASGKRVVVLGAGGAGRSVVEALGRVGVADLCVVNRDSSKAESAAALAEIGRVGTLADVPDADLIVNATSVGMRPEDELPPAAKLLQSRQLVADLIYHPVETALLGVARGLGASTMNGIPMLLHQAALQVNRWTGLEAPIDVMRHALHAELSTRL